LKKLKCWRRVYDTLGQIEIKGVETMPNRDGSGPNGKGPKTGRRKGNC